MVHRRVTLGLFWAATSTFFAMLESVDYLYAILFHPLPGVRRCACGAADHTRFEPAVRQDRRHDPDAGWYSPAHRDLRSETRQRISPAADDAHPLWTDFGSAGIRDDFVRPLCRVGAGRFHFRLSGYSRAI